MTHRIAVLKPDYLRLGSDEGNGKTPPFRVGSPQFTGWSKRQCAFFHEEHRTDRWDLSDYEDSFQLYYQLRILSLRYLKLYHLRSRDHQYARAHEAWACYWILGVVEHDLFPFIDDSGASFSMIYNNVQREIAELEEKFGIEA